MSEIMRKGCLLLWMMPYYLFAQLGLFRIQSFTQALFLSFFSIQIDHLTMVYQQENLAAVLYAKHDLRMVSNH